MTDFVASTLERHRRYGWSAPEGEWGAIQAEDRSELKMVLDAQDADETRSVLATMFQGPLAYGLVSIDGTTVPQLHNMVMWRLALWAKVVGGPDIDILAASPAGSPLTVPVTSATGENVLLTVDTPRFDCYAHRIAHALKASGTVFEIGCGYGGTALQLTRRAPAVRVVLCDIPETLYLAGYFLAESGVAVQWWDDATSDASVILLPAHELAHWTEPVDLVFSAHSLSGMGPVALEAYLQWLPHSGAKYFYHDDSTKNVPGVWLADRFAEITDIVPPSCFVLKWKDATPWTGLTDRFCECFYERAA